MPHDSLPPDAAHGRSLPAGVPAARIIRAVFRQAGVDTRRHITRYARLHHDLPSAGPDLSRFIKPMSDTLLESGTFLRYFQRGYKEAAARIGKLARRPIRLRSFSARYAQRQGVWLQLQKEGPPVIAFDLYNPRIETAVNRLVLDLCQETLDTLRREVDEALASVREALRQGLARGDGVAQLNARMGAIFDDPYKAARIGQTEASRSVHVASLLAAKTSGVVSAKRWLCSGDACEKICMPMDGREVGLDEDFAVIGTGKYSHISTPPAHPHCFLPDATVQAPGIVAALRAAYDGPALRVSFASGDTIACTPNHLWLTPNGFVPASFLAEGNDVVYCPVGEGTGFRDANDDSNPSLIGDVFESLCKRSMLPLAAVGSSPEDLHGDARFCETDIHVVRADGFLGNALNSTGLEPGQDFQFSDASASSWADHAVLARSDFAAVLECMFQATACRVGFERESFAFFLGHLREQEDLGCFVGADWHASLFQRPINDVVMDVEISGDLPCALAAGVAGDDQCSVKANTPADLKVFGRTELDASFGNAHLHGVAGESVFLSDVGESHTAFVKPSHFLHVDVNHPVPTNTLASHREPSCNSAWGDTERLRQVMRRFPGTVTTSKISKIDVFHYRGPVYDLETSSSLYGVGKGLIVSNCMCTMTEVL